MRYIALLLFMFFSLPALHAQESDSVSNLEETIDAYDQQETNTDESYEQTTHTIVTPDSLKQTSAYKAEKINVRKFDQKKWKEIIGDLNYEEKPTDEKESTAPKPLTISPWNNEILRIISFTVIIAIVLVIIFYISKNTTLNYKIKKKKIQDTNFEEPVENIEDFDINALLERTLAEGNLRLAVRLYYLSLLKKLNETGIIVWQKEKTNREYLTELFSRNYYFEEVRFLTFAYEQVWYGEHALNLETFQKLAKNFESLNQKLNTSKTL